jgi:hypothetical protein
LFLEENGRTNIPVEAQGKNEKVWYGLENMVERKR